MDNDNALRFRRNFLEVCQHSIRLLVLFVCLYNYPYFSKIEKKNELSSQIQVASELKNFSCTPKILIMSNNSTRLILEPHHSRLLSRISWLLIISVVVAVRNQRMDCAIAASSLMLTSINYWRNPVLGWRRNLDILVAFGGFTYQVVIVAACAPAKNLYLLSVVICLWCYLRALYCGRVLGDPATAVGWHCAIHICGNLGNCILYESLGGT